MPDRLTSSHAITDAPACISKNLIHIKSDTTISSES
jgi:hypothetical protein